MKKSILLFSLLTFCLSVFSQTNLEEIELYQSLFGMEKKYIVSSFISLEGETADAFWGQYDEYESARKANGQKRLKLLSEYANSYLNMDDATSDAIVAESIKINKEKVKHISKYYKIIKKSQYPYVISLSDHKEVNYFSVTSSQDFDYLKSGLKNMVKHLYK